MGSFADKFLPDFKRSANLIEFETPSAVRTGMFMHGYLGRRTSLDKHKGPVLDSCVAFRYAAQAG